MPRAMDDLFYDETIDHLNKRGEGVAADDRVVPLALPGELVRRDAETLTVLTPSLDRAAPICRYFGDCGGCAAQHMSPRLYSEWKRRSLVAALARAGVAAEVGGLVDAHGAGRRRATFHARFHSHGQEDVGFMRARAHEIVSIEECPLFSPEMAGAIEAARALAGELRGLDKPLDIQATASLNGLDFDLRGSGPLQAVERRKLARAAEALDLARVSNHGEILIERRAPVVAFGEARVILPPGGFLQATLAGEELLANGAAAALVSAGRVADLFCGAGAFALRLAAGHEIFAVDSDAAAIYALQRASGEARGLRAIEAVVRDLFQRPLRPDELDRFDAVLFDPPRAGALAQARALGESRVPVVVAISCNVDSFARDARMLIDGGYAIESVTPLDQFRFSPHLEILAVFRRPRAKRRPKGVLG
jgi:23S rRNA (uracil1939-C5)-methyltransferase